MLSESKALRLTALVLALSASIAAFIHGCSFGPQIGLFFGILAAFVLATVYGAFAVNDQYEWIWRIISILIAVPAFLFMAYPRYVFQDFGYYSNRDSSVPFESVLQRDLVLRHSSKPVLQANSMFSKTPKFEKLTVQKANARYGFDVTGEVALFQDLLAARQELLALGLDDIYWKVRITELDETVMGEGDDALVKLLIQ